MGRAKARRLTRPLVLLWLATFAFFLSFLLLLSALPIFARRLGASDGAIGLIMGAFGVTSLLLRAPTGWGADRWGRRPFMLAGALVFTVASVAYAWSVGPLSLLLVRLVHGAGMGLYPTAASAMVADIAPPERRGEILGIYGAAGSVALAVGPIAGIAIVERLGFAALCWIAGAAAAGALVLTLATRETLPRPRAMPFTAADALCRPALLPSSIALCLMLGYGAQVAFVPLYADTLGVNAGVFFLAFAIAVTLVRAPAGRVSDRIGRVPVAAAGLLLGAVELAALTRAEGTLGIAAAGALYGLGYGMAQPALVAWTFDRVAEDERGRAVGTYYNAFEIGIIVGAATSGFAVARWGFTGTFMTAAAITAGSAAFAIARRRG